MLETKGKPKFKRGKYRGRTKLPIHLRVKEKGKKTKIKQLPQKISKALGKLELTQTQFIGVGSRKRDRTRRA